jgi:hypothetical protein
MRAGVVPHTVGKLLTRTTTLLENSSQLEVFTQNYGPQSCGSPNFGNFGTPTWEYRDKMTFGCWFCGQTKYTIRGKVVASPKSEPWWILWVRGYPWHVRAPKCSNYALTNLLLSLCKSMWVIILVVNLPSPILKLQHAPLPLKCCEPKSAPQLFLLPLSSTLDL